MFSASTTGPVNVFKLKPIHSTSYLLKSIHSTSCLKPTPPLCWVPIPPCPSKPVAVLIAQVPSTYLLLPACPLPPPAGFHLLDMSCLYPRLSFFPSLLGARAHHFMSGPLQQHSLGSLSTWPSFFCFGFILARTFFFPLTTPFGVWNVSCLTRNGTRFLASESAESQPSDCYLHGHP